MAKQKKLIPPGVLRGVFSSIDTLKQHGFNESEIIDGLIKIYPGLKLNEKSAKAILSESRITPLGSKRKPVKVKIMRIR